MIAHNELKRGVQFTFQGDAYEVQDSSFTYKGRGSSTVQAKMKNLKTGAVITHTFHAGDAIEEAELGNFKAKFIYSNKDTYVFSRADNASERFELSRAQIGEQARFLKDNETVDAITFEHKIINIVLPIKVQLKVTEAPPGVRGDRAQGGTKVVILETGTTVDVPLFVEANDIVEVNTESGEYTRRVQE
jgi:elongation factor P|tara:strand:+ start:614 stop:1180 length:567 start_codon:yes stop_codon:yes gene_type:complete